MVISNRTLEIREHDANRIVAAIDRPDAPELRVHWPNNETIEITGSLKPGQVVSVQENAHPGWHAAVDGSTRRVFAHESGWHSCCRSRAWR